MCISFLFDDIPDFLVKILTKLLLGDLNLAKVVVMDLAPCVDVAGDFFVATLKIVAIADLGTTIAITILR